MHRILLVDDDINVLEITKSLLETKGYNVVAYSDSKEGILDALKNDYDLIIVDYSMPEIGGDSFVDICKSVHDDVNIIVYSGAAHDDEEYRMLNKDIFDFINKSSDPKVFLKRVERALKSDKKISTYSHILESSKENIIVDYNNRIVKKDGNDIRLSNIEIMVLSLFLSRMNETISRDYIHEVVWESRGQSLDDIRIIDAYVLKLRRKLNLQSIVSVRGVGYVWAEK